MIPIPEMTNLDVAFSNAEHLPPMKDIPDEFKRNNNAFAGIVSKWFFNGLDSFESVGLTPKKGVEKGKAIAALKAIIGSYEPQHEHKTAGVAFLMSEWFDLDEGKQKRKRHDRH